MPLLIGIAGGTGSGKTTIARSIKAAFSDDERVTRLELDAYYKNFSSLFPYSPNFDLRVTPQ